MCSLVAKNDAKFHVGGQDLLGLLGLLIGELFEVARQQHAVAVLGLGHAPALAHLLVGTAATLVGDHLVGLGDHVKVAHADLCIGQSRADALRNSVDMSFAT